MSPAIAGNLDLIQLAGVNSPIFQTQNHQFHTHLWTFIGSATVYSDTVLALMEKFNWKPESVLSTTVIVHLLVRQQCRF